MIDARTRDLAKEKKRGHVPQDVLVVQVTLHIRIIFQAEAPVIQVFQARYSEITGPAPESQSLYGLDTPYLTF